MKIRPAIIIALLALALISSGCDDTTVAIQGHRVNEISQANDQNTIVIDGMTITCDGSSVIIVDDVVYCDGEMVYNGEPESSDQGDIDPYSVNGSGDVLREIRPVNAFNVITLDGDGDVEVTMTDRETLEIEAEDNILPLLKSEIHGSTLELGLEPNTLITTTQGWRYFITARTLNLLEINGNGNVVIRGLHESDWLLEINGNATVTASGHVANLTVAITGAGNFNGFSMTGDNVTIDISGFGNAHVHATDNLIVRISGAGNVLYEGRPTVRQNISGTGEVHPHQP